MVGTEGAHKTKYTERQRKQKVRKGNAQDVPKAKSYLSIKTFLMFVNLNGHPVSQLYL